MLNRSLRSFRRRSPEHGFTMAELILVIVIIGVVAGVAMPLYGDYVTRTKLTVIGEELSSMGAAMQSYLQDHQTYVGSCLPGSTAPLPANKEYAAYACPAESLTSTSFKITATGSGSLSGLVLSLDQDNTRKTESVGNGWLLPTADCWVQSKGGC